MEMTGTKLRRGNEFQIDLQADREIRRILLRWTEQKLAPPGLWRWIRSGLEKLQAVQPQVTIYPYGELETRGEVKEA